MSTHIPLSADTERSLVNWTTLIYALHAFSLVTGILGTATIIGAFLTGWPSIIAVILMTTVIGISLGLAFLMVLPFLLVAALVVYHFYCGRIIRDFASNSCRRSHIWFRWFNELPVLVLFAVVILAVVKPV